MTRAYSKFSLPLFDTAGDAVKHTLVDQSGGVAQLMPAVDAAPAETGWRSTLPLLDDAAALYSLGLSLTQIAIKLGIAWDSVARLLDRAGARERKNKRR